MSCASYMSFFWIVYNRLKPLELVSKNFLKSFCEYIGMENPSYKIASSHSKIAWIVLSIMFPVLKSFSKTFCEYIKMENSVIKTKILRENTLRICERPNL